MQVLIIVLSFCVLCGCYGHVIPHTRSLRLSGASPELAADCFELEQSLIVLRLEQQFVDELLVNMTKGEIIEYVKRIGIATCLDLVANPIGNIPIFNGLYHLMPDAFAQTTVSEVISQISSESMETFIEHIEDKVAKHLAKIKAKYHTKASLRMKFKVIEQLADDTQETIIMLCPYTTTQQED